MLNRAIFREEIMQCTMQMWHSGESEYRDKCGHQCIIKIRSLCLWWQAVSLDKGVCQAVLGIAAHLDSVSGNYVFTKLSICELCLV